jgi:hypothetical protein
MGAERLSERRTRETLEPVRRRILLAVVPFALALPFAACDDPESVATILDAAENTLASGSAAFEMRVAVEGSEQIPDGEITGSGAASYEDPKLMHGTFDFGALPVGTIEVIVDERFAYMRGAAFAEFAGDAETWLRVDLTSTDATAQELQGLVSGQNDASLLLYYLFGADGQIDSLGTETIGGVEATGYSVSLDLDEALARVPEEAREALELNLDEFTDGGIAHVLDAEVWIDGEGFVRRLVFVYELGDEVGGGRIGVTSDLSAFGEPVEVEAPSDDDVVDVEDLAA